MDYVEYDENLIGEGPCEFCGDSYPLILLIEHQSTHLVDGEYREDLPNDDEIQNAIIESIASEPEVVLAPREPSPIKEPEVVLAPKEPSPIKKPEVLLEAKEPLSDTKQKPTKKPLAQKMKEFTTESGEKLFVYGSDIDPEKNVENKEQTYKMPNNPLLNAALKEDDVEDINNLSDDDCSETLEEFWKRARDYLKRNKSKK